MGLAVASARGHENENTGHGGGNHQEIDTGPNRIGPDASDLSHRGERRRVLQLDELFGLADREAEQRAGAIVEGGGSPVVFDEQQGVALGIGLDDHGEIRHEDSGCRVEVFVDDEVEHDVGALRRRQDRHLVVRDRPVSLGGAEGRVLGDVVLDVLAEGDDLGFERLGRGGEIDPERRPEVNRRDLDATRHPVVEDRDVQVALFAGVRRGGRGGEAEQQQQTGEEGGEGEATHVKGSERLPRG